MPFPFFSLRLCAPAGKSLWIVADGRSSPAETQRRGEIQDQSGHPFHPLDPCEYLPSVLIFAFSL